MIFIIILLIAFLIWLAYEFENAPLLTDEGDVVYKSHITFFGIKLYKRKK